MNDNSSATLGATRTGFGGLPQRLVQDGVVDEAAMLEAVNTARERRTNVVTQLVASGAASARDIAVAASNEYGVPLFDVDATNLDLEVVRLVSDKLLAKHRVLPLFRRGKRSRQGLRRSLADCRNDHPIYRRAAPDCGDRNGKALIAADLAAQTDDALHKVYDAAGGQPTAEQLQLSR